MLSRLASTGLTVALCLVLAAVSVAGSLLFRGNTLAEGGFPVFRSPLFLVPAALLLANVAACTWLRLSARGLSAATLPFLGLHAGLVVAMAGLLADGALSSTSTRYYGVGVATSKHFDWTAGEERRFPFLVEVTDFRVDHWPLPLRLGVKGAGGEKHGPWETREGVPFRVEPLGLSVTPGRFDFATGLLPASVSRPGLPAATVSVRQGEAAPLPGGGELHLLARFEEPEPSGYRVALRFHPPGGAPPVGAEARVNRPAHFGGYRFCFVDHRPDGSGGTLVGFQVTREPGAPWFWGGSLLFLASLLAHMAPRLRGAAPSAGAAATAALLPLLLLLPRLSAADGGAPPPGTAPAPVSPASPPRSLRWEGEVAVASPLRLGAGESLTVLPGATVLLSTEDRDGDGAPDGRIEVAGGTLRVLGEKGREVRFLPAPAPPSPGGAGGGEGRWDEIFLLEAAGEVRHAVFEGARFALHVHFGTVRVERSLFRGNGGAVRSRGTTLELDRCDVEGNGVGLRFWDGGPRATRCRFEGNHTALFYREGGGGGKIEGSVFRGNSEDLRVGDWAVGGLDLSGNHFAGRPPLVSDFRDEGAGGEISLRPVLEAEPQAGRNAP